MSEQRFPAGAAPKLRVIAGGGDISIEVWDEDAISVECDSPGHELYQEGDTLAINSAQDDLEIRVPARTEVFISRQAGDVRVEGVRKAAIERAYGDVDLENLSECAELGELSGDLTVEGAPRVVGPGPIRGSAELSNVQSIEIQHVDGDLTIDDAVVVILGSLAGDLSIDSLAERLQAGAIGGDLHIDTKTAVEIVVNSVGGDLQIDGSLGTLRCSNVGGDLVVDGRVDSASLSNVAGDLRIDRVRELRVSNVGGDVRTQGSERVEIGSVGSDCKLSNLAGGAEIGTVGGDLSIQGSFPAGSSVRANVAGDASVQLPRTPSVSLDAIVGGELRGVATSDGSGHKRVNLRYGAGEAGLSLRVGGDLRISGAGAPESVSSSTSSSGSSSAGDSRLDFDVEGFGREMSELGRELGRMGRELAGEISAAFANEGAARGGAWAEEAARKVEEKARRFQEHAEERARRAEEHARHAEEKARLRVKINEREWQLDPERLERIKEQARRAAAEGVAGAMEVVERAIGRIRVPAAPVPPVPPIPPAPPAPPAPATGATIRIVVDAPDAPDTLVGQGAVAPRQPAASPEQERETILRMIAEGRISPDEGDLLLDALG